MSFDLCSQFPFFSSELLNFLLPKIWFPASSCVPILLSCAKADATCAVCALEDPFFFSGVETPPFYFFAKMFLVVYTAGPLLGLRARGNKQPSLEGSAHSVAEV